MEAKLCPILEFISFPLSRVDLTAQSPPILRLAHASWVFRKRFWRYIEIYDIDGDGKSDLIIPDYFNNVIAITRNTSTAGTISFAPKVTFPWAPGGQPNEVSIGDFDGDGKPDFAVGGNGGGSFVSVYRNLSTPGTIDFAARQDFTASSGQGNGNRIIDIDGDGRPDLLSVHWSGNCLWVLRNTSTGPGVISFAAGVSFATTTQPHKIDVGDLDGDSLGVLRDKFLGRPLW